MSVTCPDGHVSATDDFCDQCGVRIPADDEPEEPEKPEEDEEEEVLGSEVTITEEVGGRSTPGVAQRCPNCQTPRTGDDRFCEVDGYDFVAGAVTSRPPRWEAVVTADRAYYDAVAPDGVDFPVGYETRTFTLDADEVLVGRRSESRNIEPTIDLSGSLEDAGVSHRHAVFLRSEDGSYTLVDRGSTNGTSVNGTTDVVPLDTPVPLVDGDRIHIGAWTTITIRCLDP